MTDDDIVSSPSAESDYEYPVLTASTPLYEVVVSCEWSVPRFAVGGDALRVLREANATAYELTLNEVTFVVRPPSANRDAIRAIIVETLSTASGGSLLEFVHSPGEAGFDIVSISRIQCEYGCGKPATIRNAPMVVNSRLYTGLLCDECHLPPAHLQHAFAEGSDPYEVLAALQAAYEART